MPDIGAGRTAEPPMRRRFERQQREHVVGVGSHGLGTTRPPRPDARAHIIDDRKLGQRLADALRDAMREIRAVDNDENVGTCCDDRSCRIPNSPKNGRQARKHGQNSHHRDVRQRKSALQTFGRHAFSADAHEAQFALRASPHRPHELEAELIPGRFPGDDADREQASVGHRAKPVRNNPRRSAARSRSSLSMRITSPAATAIPANPASAASSTVLGPMAGRSTRRS